MNASKISFISLLLMTVLLMGCAPKQDLYYWGEYSDSLYDLKKNPGEESIASHMAALEHVVDESKNRNLRIPPGVCAELGYLYARKNDKKRATELFLMEKDTYPESTILMERLIQQTEMRFEEEEEEVPKEINKEKANQ